MPNFPNYAISFVSSAIVYESVKTMFAYTIRDFLVVTSLVIQFYFTDNDDAVVVVVIVASAVY